MESIANLVTCISKLEPKQYLELIKKIRKFCPEEKIKNVGRYYLQQEIKLTKQNELSTQSHLTCLVPTNTIDESIKEKSAFSYPILLRVDKIPVGQKLFLDVEKLDLRVDSNLKSATSRHGIHESVASIIGITTEEGTLVLSAFIYWPDDDVCKY